MRVAGLFDIHGNLPALDAVLEDVREARVDRIVAGGDVVLGPMPRETLQRLLRLDRPVHFLQGNCELAVLAQMAALDGAPVTYWGTTSGKPLPDPLREGYQWVARQLRPEHETTIASWPRTVRLEIPGLGQVLFCHGTPRSETEVFTRLTAEERLRPVFDGVDAAVVVCGHTHMPFDRNVGQTRVVNAGSVGAPFGNAGADWALLGPDVELRHTTYDLVAAAERIRATAYPQAEEMARDTLSAPSEAEMLKLFSAAEVGRMGAVADTGRRGP